MFSPPVATIANHLLAAQPWLRERLLPFVGKTLELRAPALKVALTVGADGLLQAAAADACADAFAMVDPGRAFDLVTHGLRAVDVQGDAAFAAAVAGVLSELRWDAEEDLSRLLGDIAAHRVVEGARALIDWQRKTALSLAATATDYLTEEQPLLASRTAVDQFIAEVDTLRDAVERLEKRLARLEAR